MRIVASFGLAVITLLANNAAQAGTPRAVIERAKREFRSSARVPVAERTQTVTWSNGKKVRGTKGVYTGTLSTSHTVRLPSIPGENGVAYQADAAVAVKVRVDTSRDRVTITDVARLRPLLERVR